MSLFPYAAPCIFICQPVCVPFCVPWYHGTHLLVGFPPMVPGYPFVYHGTMPLMLNQTCNRVAWVNIHVHSICTYTGFEARVQGRWLAHGTRPRPRPPPCRSSLRHAAAAIRQSSVTPFHQSVCPGREPLCGTIGMCDTILESGIIWQHTV